MGQIKTGRRFRAKLRLRWRCSIRRTLPVVCASALVSVMSGSWLTQWDAGSMPPKREAVARRVLRSWPLRDRTTAEQLN